MPYFVFQGHTHEDIDARFSKISKALNATNAFTLPQLAEVVSGSVKKSKMAPVLLPCVYDIKEWLAPVLNGIHNHSFPHVYR